MLWKKKSIFLFILEEISNFDILNQIFKVCLIELDFNNLSANLKLLLSEV